MTATHLDTSSSPDTWAQQLAQLQERYRQVRPPILVALNLLLSDQNIQLDDAKAQAQLRGVRITAASMNAARTLLSRMDAPQTAPAAPLAASPILTAAPVARAPRRPRTPQPPIDAEAMIRGFVDQLRGEKNAEVERMKDGIRRAIAALQAVVG
jgi:hypothetical protein